MGGKYRGQKRVHYKYKNYTSGLETKIYKILFDTDPPVLENILITRYSDNCTCPILHILEKGSRKHYISVACLNKKKK